MLRQTHRAINPLSGFFRSFSASANSQFARVSLLGNIANIEEKESGNGTKYLRYSIAVNHKKDTPPSWFNVTVFSEPQANFILTHLGKGAKVFVECDARNNTFEKEDGSKGVTLNLVQKSIDVVNFPKKSEEEVN